MSKNTLTISILQPDITWEDKRANTDQYTRMIEGISGRREIVLLPEMFTTGFSMAPERLAETMDGPSVSWMKETARRFNIILAGSLIIEEEGHYYNRFVWMQPDGQYGTYDKRHLFGYAGEDKHYTGGDKKLIVQVKGWKICPLICYDLRFPVWARQTVTTTDEARQPAYDVLLYVANWPQRRSLAWKTLLQARAIENQAYVVGVNRVGKDAHDIDYSGDSAVFGPLGEALWLGENKPLVYTLQLEKAPLQEARDHFPFLKDGDAFLLL